MSRLSKAQFQQMENEIAALRQDNAELKELVEKFARLVQRWSAIIGKESPNGSEQKVSSPVLGGSE